MFLWFNDYHHDIAIFKTGDDADLPKENQVGLVHVALVTDGFETVRQFYDHAKAMGVEVAGWTSHAITKSLYVKDPEGNTIEIYADVPLEEYNWPEHGMGFITRPFDIDAVPVTAATEASSLTCVRCRYAAGDGQDHRPGGGSYVGPRGVG
jgi:catechol 2,3-dioxygenase